MVVFPLKDVSMFYAVSYLSWLFRHSVQLEDHLLSICEEHLLITGLYMCVIICSVSCSSHLGPCPTVNSQTSMCLTQLCVCPETTCNFDEYSKFPIKWTLQIDATTSNSFFFLFGNIMDGKQGFIYLNLCLCNKFCPLSLR